MRLTGFVAPLLALIFVASGALAMSGCSSGSGESTPPLAAPAGRKVDAATAGSIAGKVMFTGTPPVREAIRMGSDPACQQSAGPNPQSDAVLVSKDGALQNAFVYVKDGLDPSYTFDAATTPVVLDQRGCTYAPRVLGLGVNQPLVLTNDDPTFHNIHALPKVNHEFNHGLAVKGQTQQEVFTKPEVMVRVKCDVHGWMAAWVGVVAHPFFAVSAADGSFELKGLPPGTYTIEAWHERFGTRTAQVTVADHQAQTVAFSFAAN